jgi:hypothetical protein
MAGPLANPPVMLAKGPRMDLMGLLQVLGQVRAGTGPLTEAELQELERLVRMPPEYTPRPDESQRFTKPTCSGWSSL